MQRRLEEAAKLADAGKHQEALVIYKALTEQYPQLHSPWVGLGCMEGEISRDRAEPFGGKDAFAKAIQIRVSPHVLNDLANIFLRNEWRWREAEKFYKEAVIRHGLLSCAENLAICMMTVAPMKGTEEAWREAWQWYEWRTMNVWRDADQCWRGEPLKGKRIVIHLEQGLGDHAFGFRFIKQAKEEGATTLVMAPKPLERLCKAQPYIDHVYESSKQHKILTDYVTGNMSMPGYMLPHSLPKRDGGYIKSGLPMQKTGKTRIGLAWAGSVDKNYQAWRNIPLGMLGAITAILPNVEFVSLQKGEHENDAPEVPLNRQLIKRCIDLWDTARLIESCDLVISTDTVIPHLSAAIGVETWVLSRWIGDWMWGAAGHDPGWYFNTTIFRQPSFGAWMPVMDSLMEYLENWDAEQRHHAGQSGRPESAGLILPAG